jgi:membrane protein implicated in regulation of membrane protease activity
VAGAALLVGLLSEMAPSSVTGAGAGLALLAFAALVLAGPEWSRRRHAGSRPPAP